jgi:hypothetical protein
MNDAAEPDLADSNSPVRRLVTERGTVREAGHEPRRLAPSIRRTCLNFRRVVACGRGESDTAALLAYYGVPLLLTTDGGFVALTSGDQVVAAVQQQVDGMRAVGRQICSLVLQPVPVIAL